MIKFIRKLEEKLFGKSNELSSLASPIYIETIKLVDYWDYFKQWDKERKRYLLGDNTPHWLNMLTSLIYSLSDIGNRYQVIYLLVDHQLNPKVRGNVLKTVKGVRKDPKEYIRDRWKELREQKIRGVTKYPAVKHRLNEEELIRLIKYICLMFSGQISVNDSKGITKIDQMEVDYRRDNRLGRNDI